MALPSPYTARFEGVEEVVWTLTTTLECPVYEDGNLVAPTAGTITIYNAAREKVVDGVAVTIAGSVATYIVASATVADETPEAGWQVVWSLTLSGDTHEFDNEAALVRRKLYPVLTDQDLFRRVPALDPSADDTFWDSDITNLESWRDEAWTEINDRLVEEGVRPALTLSPTAFRRVHRALTLALIFEYLATTLSQEHAQTGERYRDEFKSAWGDLRFVVDEDEDGDPDSTEREPAIQTVWLMG
jgi:hypothetical protein